MHPASVSVEPDNDGGWVPSPAMGEPKDKGGYDKPVSRDEELEDQARGHDEPEPSEDDQSENDSPRTDKAGKDRVIVRVRAARLPKAEKAEVTRTTSRSIAVSTFWASGSRLPRQ